MLKKQDKESNMKNYMYMLKINYLKEKIVSEEACITRNLDREKINKFISSLPFAHNTRSTNSRK